MFDIYYQDAVDEWINNHNLWLKGEHPDQKECESAKDYKFYAQWNGDCPDVERYWTRKFKKEELTHIQLYETTSEGTPISPIFHINDFEKLCEYAAQNCTAFGDYKVSKERWMDILKGEILPNLFIGIKPK